MKELIGLFLDLLYICGMILFFKPLILQYTFARPLVFEGFLGCLFLAFTLYFGQLAHHFLFRFFYPFGCFSAWLFFMMTSISYHSKTKTYSISDLNFFFWVKQKQDSFLTPLLDQQAKEGKDKKVIFEAKFSKPNAKYKWFCRKDVSSNI